MDLLKLKNDIFFIRKIVSNYKNKNQKILKYKQFFRFIIANKKIHNFLGHIL